MLECSNLLLEIPLFQNISMVKRKPLLHCLGGQISNYRKGDAVSLTGNKHRNIGVILSGKLYMMKEDLWGDLSVYTTLSEKAIFGEAFLCGGMLQNTISFSAATDCKILFLPYERLMHSCCKSCEEHQILIENMMSLIAQKNAQIMEKLEITSKKTIREKVLTYLSQLAQKTGGCYFMSPMGRMELADYLCVDRSALTRELTRMRTEGILDYDRNTFRILKRKSG